MQGRTSAPGRRPMALAVAIVVALGATLAFAGIASATKLGGGTTTLTAKKSVLKKLKKAGVKVKADDGATKSGKVFTLPISGGEEPGTAAQIQQFCSRNYGVSFPMTEKLKVNGKGRSPLYATLVNARDEGGYSGDVRWNFEKFLVAPDGRVVGRFDSETPPDAPRIREAIEAVLRD